MLPLLEFCELLRAFGFPGSDAAFIVSIILVFVYAARCKLTLLRWWLYGYLLAIPIIYASLTGRVELVMHAFSVACLIFVMPGKARTFILPGQRILIFSMLALVSFFKQSGEPLYQNSSFNSLFDSGNAFIYYLLINACIVAFGSRSVWLTTFLALPLLMIQTKSVVVLGLSSRRFLLVSLVGVFLVVFYFGLKFFERIAWMLNAHGLVYALGAGRIERVASTATEYFTVTRLLFGGVLSPSLENFEIEFLDMIGDFGLIYAAILYYVSFSLIYRVSGRQYFKPLMLFLLLNVSGHFWNNPLLVVTFISVVCYADGNRNKHVSRF